MKTLQVIRYKQPISYLESFFYQKKLRSELIQNRRESDKLIILQHEPVFTLGRRSKIEDLLFTLDGVKNKDILNLSKLNFDNEADIGSLKYQDYFNIQAKIKNLPFEVFKVDRGGEITYHCPGQIVFYLIFNLENHKKDLHWFLRRIENLIMTVLRTNYSLEPTLHSKYTGVWIGQNKIASIGLSASKWVTMHGLSLNVDFDLSPFSKIVPCGISDKGLGVTSLAKQTHNKSLSLEEVQSLLLKALVNEFEFIKVKQYDRNYIVSKA